MPLHVTIVGLRDLQGRFASMAAEGLRLIQMEEAAVIGRTMQDVFRNHAPRSGRGASPTGRHFFEGLEAAVAATAAGFEITIETDQPLLRKWLTEGTGVFAGHGRIFPTKSRALMWTNWSGHGSGPFFAASIAGMKGRPWEEEARAEVEGLVEVAGNRIGVRVVQALAGGV